MYNGLSYICIPNTNEIIDTTSIVLGYCEWSYLLPPSLIRLNSYIFILLADELIFQVQRNGSEWNTSTYSNSGELIMKTLSCDLNHPCSYPIAAGIDFCTLEY